MTKLQQKKIDHFETKYMGIDISKLHEELEGYKTRYYAAKIAEKSVLDQLYEVRDRMLKVASAYDKHKDSEYQKFLTAPKTYAGLATDL